MPFYWQGLLLIQLLVDGSHDIFRYLINVLDSKYLVQECTDDVFAGYFVSLACYQIINS